MTLMAIDGNSLVNRAYYGVRMLNAPDGTPTNAIYGFLAILRPLLEEYRPDALAVAFDRREPTFRHRACGFYKAQRKPLMPYQQITFRRICKCHGIPVKIRERCLTVHINTRESLIGQHQGKGQISIRHKILTLYRSYSTSRCHNMKRLLDSRHRG
jgi:hypothetical protein